MDIKLSNCFLAVDDHDQAIEFYRDVLGFEVRNDVGYENMRWVTVGPKLQPEIEIVLEPPGAEASQVDRETIKDLMAKGIFARLVFSTADVDATFKEIEAAGAAVVQEPIDQGWGVRDCAFRDPSGNLLRFKQAAG